MSESTAAANVRSISPVTEFRSALEGTMRDEVAKQLPKGIDPDRFIRTTITTVQMHPELLESNRSSLFAACMQAAKDGLLPDNREATIQIYSTKVKAPDGSESWVKMAQYMPMVRGLIKKMYEAGCTKIDAAAVYERDHFRFTRGDDSCIEHEPYLGMEEPGPIVASYAIVNLENGEIKREVMPRRDIEKVREASKASNGPGWTKWYDQFAIKAVLKRIYKQIPEASEFVDSVIAADNKALGITFDQHDAKDTAALTGEGMKTGGSLEPPKSGGDALKDKIKGKVETGDTKPEEQPTEEQPE